MLQALLEFLRTLTNPEKLIQLLSTVLGGPLGYAMLSFVVFAETGLLMGFFLPGDSLLFTVGVVAGAGELNIFLINLVLMASAIIGDGVGYYLGRRTGPAIFNRPDSRFFKQEYLHRTQEFYRKHGGKTIIYARFVPIVRTFAPFIAGVGQMEYKRFASFNIFGGIGWVFSMTMAGYMLGGIPIIQRHFEKVVIGIVFVSVVPILVEYLKGRTKKEPGSVSGR
ncbi:MAG: VTT domain-containing protein [Bryobacterales bacterium]|nr:VTT domain-containing protein [Bryobacterales bacterium]